MNQTKTERPLLYVVPRQNTMSITCGLTPLKIVGTDPPRRPPNKVARAREYFFPEEIEAMRLEARKTRYPIRDEAIVLVGYRHGLRIGELVGLRWDDINLGARIIHIRREKGGSEQCHVLADDEAQLLARLPRTSEYVFMSERGGRRLSGRGAFDVVQKLGRAIGFKAAHPHMLRHSRGYVLANRGVPTHAIQLYLGHKDIRSTQHYIQLAHEQVRGLEQG